MVTRLGFVHGNTEKAGLQQPLITPFHYLKCSRYSCHLHFHFKLSQQSTLDARTKNCAKAGPVPSPYQEPVTQYRDKQECTWLCHKAEWDKGLGWCLEQSRSSVINYRMKKHVINEPSVTKEESIFFS